MDETILGILRVAGFPDADAVVVYHAFIDLTLAFAALDAGSLALTDEARAADEEMWQSTYTELPADTHPHIAATARLLAGRMTHSAYPVVLDTLLNSAAEQLVWARARRHPGAPGTRKP